MDVSDFDGFFYELYGYKPFYWQKRLMKQVIESGWPSFIDLPTSAGKTAVIDISIFHLAMEANKPPKDSRAPRRIFFVVDRRLVVDEAYERSKRICCKLRDSKQGILAEIAQRLKNFIPGDDPEPLKVVRLRGGLPREATFIKNPLQPTIVISTVDQIGSRLLFRGYGVSEYARPINAALVGIDSIIILDEAHLSRPFSETLDWVRFYQSETWAERQIGKPVKIVQMTATPSEENKKLFTLSNRVLPKVSETIREDNDWEHPILGPRLTCSKPSELVEVEWDDDKAQESKEEMIKTLVKKAKEMMETTRKYCKAPVVGVIVNRVMTAREVFSQLSMIETDSILLTGRSRPFDRKKLLDSYLERIKAGRADNDNTSPLYVVATQTVEVGADIDFDAIVTEAAALDALRQRFGRLNRFGKRNYSRAVIVSLKGKVDPDVIYGEALNETWKWMVLNAKKKSRGKPKEIDFGIEAMNGLLNGKDISSMLTPHDRAPVLMPAHIDMLVQTSPTPAIDPDIPLYLHGEMTQSEDVQIIWRADLPAFLPFGEKEEASVIETVSILPPTQIESLELSIKAARSLMGRRIRVDITDIEGGQDENDEANESSDFYAIKWRGHDKSTVIRSTLKIQPGDTLIVPSSYGGLDEFGWNPNEHGHVNDVGDEAVSEKRGRLFLRVHKDILPSWFIDGDGLQFNAIKALDKILSRLDDEDLHDLCDELVEELLHLPGLKQDIQGKLCTLKSNRSERIYPESTASNGILLMEKPASNQANLREILLKNHNKSVAELARNFAEFSGLTDAIVADVTLSGIFHDSGKADPRFQAGLQGGIAKCSDLLAKSQSSEMQDPRISSRAFRKANYPIGARHECYSVALLQSNNDILSGSYDWDLVLHLIGTHHGRGRSLMPSIEDIGCKIDFEFNGHTLSFNGQHNLEQLNSGWSDRFWRLNRRYGYWGLAYLEMLLRLADQRSSEYSE